MRVLLISPFASQEATGEAYVAFRWAQALSDHVDLTLAAFESPGHTPLAEQMPGTKLVTWPLPQVLTRMGRFGAMAKPEWPLFSRHIRRLISETADQFDLGHQIMPQAMRYASPFRGGPLPYVIGPLGGSIPTPPAFASEVAPPGWFARLRGLDTLRHRFDPWLRGSYAEAALLLGVAPYIRTHLDSANVRYQRFESVLELGIDGPAGPRRPIDDDRIRLLHVGRGVRTKGLRDVIRAMGQLQDPRLLLTSAGDGPEIAECRAEAARLGISDQVAFKGLIPRADVEDLYAQADIFAFPSFREPAGNVLYEAMRWGLPVIGAAAGGPDAILDETCAFKIPVTDPDSYASDIADALRALVADPNLRQRLGKAAQAKVVAEGLWTEKARHLKQIYSSVLAS